MTYDIAGNRYNSLLVLREAGMLNHQKAWLCRCDCGNEVIIRSHPLRMGTTKSCGCRRKIKQGESLHLNKRYSNYKVRARENEVPLELTKEEFYLLSRSPCYYCGELPNPTNGVDRKDNTLGYTTENSVSCCWTCNRAKGTRNEKSFLDWIYKVQSHQKEDQ